MPDYCSVNDIETATPRSVGLLALPYAQGEHVNIFVEPSEYNPAFVQNVKSTLTAEFFPYVNLQFEFVSTPTPAPDGGLVHITDNPAGLKPGASGTCKRIGKKDPYIIIGKTKTFETVVIHEMAHAVGMLHELEHPHKPFTFDRERLVAFYMARKDMSRQDAESFVQRNFFANTEKELLYGDFDTKSIMLYKLPVEVTGGVELTGSSRLSDGDKDWLEQAYSDKVTSRSDAGPSCPPCPYDSTTNMFWIICVIVFTLACAVILNAFMNK